MFWNCHCVEDVEDSPCEIDRKASREQLQGGYVIDFNCRHSATTLILLYTSETMGVSVKCEHSVYSAFLWVCLCGWSQTEVTLDVAL